MRSESANTTTMLRTKDFTIVVAPGVDGSAQGSLYLDDGESLAQPSTSNIDFAFNSSTFSLTGTFGYDPGVKLAEVAFLGQNAAPRSVSVNGAATSEDQYEYNATNSVLTVVLNASMMQSLEVRLG